MFKHTSWECAHWFGIDRLGASVRVDIKSWACVCVNINSWEDCAHWFGIDWLRACVPVDIDSSRDRVHWFGIDRLRSCDPVDINSWRDCARWFGIDRLQALKPFFFDFDNFLLNIYEAELRKSLYIKTSIKNNQIKKWLILIHSLWDEAFTGTLVNRISQSIHGESFKITFTVSFIKNRLHRAGNFRKVDIEINAWSSLFLNIETNLILYLYLEKCMKFKVTYRVSEAEKILNFALFKINIQKREGLSNFKKPVFDFLYYIQKRVDYARN